MQVGDGSGEHPSHNGHGSLLSRQNHQVAHQRGVIRYGELAFRKTLLDAPVDALTVSTLLLPIAKARVTSDSRILRFEEIIQERILLIVKRA